MIFVFLEKREIKTKLILYEFVKGIDDSEKKIIQKFEEKLKEILLAKEQTFMKLLRVFQRMILKN